MEQIFENIPFTAPSIMESTGTLKEGVLSIVKGPSFFSDGYSRNGRFYPKALWENALKLNQTKEAISRGLMFGCIGHPKNYSLDELLESGKVSHKVTDISIDPKTGDGIATYEVLDTPAGRILNTIIKSGSEMYVSTRAFGGFTDETKKKDGKEYKVLDSKNFELESIDFVIQPGFLNANPQLVENISRDLESLSEDKAKIQCSEGICQLREDLVTISEAEEKPDDIFEGIEDLPKEDVIMMLRNVVAENNLLSSSKDIVHEAESVPTMDDEASLDVDEKLLRSYISFVELLTKLVRYDVDYTQYYEKLIEFLDKDNKLTKSDVNGISSIVEKILSEDAVDESIVVVCEKLVKISDVMFGDSTDDEKELTASETFSDVVSELIHTSNGKFDLVEIEAENETLKSQIMRLKQATLVLSENSFQSETVEKVVEKVVEKEVSVTPKEISEKLVSLTDENKRLSDELDLSRQDAVSSVEESHAMIEELTTTVSELQEKMTENDMFAKEALTERNEIIKGLRDELSESKDELETNKIKISKLAKGLIEANGAKEQAEIAADASIYRLDKQVVESIYKKYTNAEERSKVLEKEAKLARKSVPVVEDLPVYSPNSRKRSASSRLENLIK